MAEILSPGVFIEEVPSQSQVVQPVSTSAMGIIGGAQRGPTDTATLCTSLDQYVRTFGNQIRDSRLYLSVAAFFANGGRRCYVTRVAPADAENATAEIQSQITDQRKNVGDGIVTVITPAVLGGSALSGRVVPSSLTFRWKAAAGAAVTASPIRNRADSAAIVGDAATRSFEGRILPSAIPAWDPVLPAISPASAMTIQSTAGGAVTITLTAATGAYIATGTNGAGSTATLDLRTGRCSMNWAVAETPAAAAPITITFTPTVNKSATDNGSGVLTGDVSAGTVTYLTGAYSLTTSAGSTAIANYGVYATYKCAALDLAPVSAGAWADDMRIVVSGNDDFYSITTDTYSRFNVAVQLLNTASGSYTTMESFEEVVLDDPEHAQYLPAVINDLSDLVVATTPANSDVVIGQLNGHAYAQCIAGGNDAPASKAVATTLPRVPLRSRTLSITYTAGGLAKTVTDDGAGNLIGDVDTSASATVNYTSGAIEFTATDDIDANTLVVASWYKAATEASHTEQFGDTTKTYTLSSVTYYAAGDDGTYDGTTQWGRSQFSLASTLEVGNLGLYSLNRVEEILQVCIPDFAGDTNVTLDLLDYVDGRAELPHGGDRFAILTTPVDSTAQEAVDYMRFTLARYSKFAAMYWPWVKVTDPLRDARSVVFPVLGHVAGIYARTDATRNVGKAPGGTIDGQLRFITGLELNPSQGERDVVYPNKINPLISSPATGTAVWGVRTISSDSDWRYVNARRLFMAVEKSVYNSTFWIVFENNGPGLWARIKSQIEGYLRGLFAQGMLAGQTPAQAFYVIVDETNNGEETIDQGQVIIDVGIAVSKPAEFVRFRFTQKTLTT